MDEHENFLMGGKMNKLIVQSINYCKIRSRCKKLTTRMLEIELFFDS